MQVQWLTSAAFEALTAGGEAVGARMIKLPSGQFCKLFRTPRGWTSSTWRPYGKRFVHAAEQLTSRGIPTVTVDALYRLEPTGRYMVVYQPLPGLSLRRMLHDSPHETDQLLPRYCSLLATLHERGVLFRSAHFDNVILCPDGKAGVIDLCAMTFFRRSLSIRQRVKNFRPPLNYDTDAAAITRLGVPRYVTSYLDAANLPAEQRAAFIARLKTQSPFWGELGAP